MGCSTFEDNNTFQEYSTLSRHSSASPCRHLTVALCTCRPLLCGTGSAALGERITALGGGRSAPQLGTTDYHWAILYPPLASDEPSLNARGPAGGRGAQYLAGPAAAGPAFPGGGPTTAPSLSVSLLQCAGGTHAMDTVLLQQLALLFDTMLAPGM
jgi:hypothetical protein